MRQRDTEIHPTMLLNVVLINIYVTYPFNIGSLRYIQSLYP